MKKRIVPFLLVLLLFTSMVVVPLLPVEVEAQGPVPIVYRGENYVDTDLGNGTHSWETAPKWVFNGSDYVPYIYEETGSYYQVQSGLIGARIFKSGYAEFWDPEMTEVRLYEEAWEVQYYDGKWKVCDTYSPEFMVESDERNINITASFITDWPNSGERSFTVKYIFREDSFLKHEVDFVSHATETYEFRVIQKWAGIVAAKVKHDKGEDVITSAITLNGPQFGFLKEDGSLSIHENQRDMYYGYNETDGSYYVLENENLKPVEIDVHSQGLKADFVFGNWTLSDGNKLTIDPSTATIYTHGDAWVCNYPDDPYVNYGDSTRLSTRWYNDGEATLTIKRSFIKFDISSIPPSSSVSLARFYVYLWSVSTDHTNRIYYVADDSWTEMGVTWPTQPSPTTDLGTITLTDSDGWKNKVITSQVLSCLADGVISMALFEEDSGRYANYRSREYDSLDPYVYVSYTYYPPTITSASITDRDDTDNLYSMKKYYTWQTVVNDASGADYISEVRLRGMDGAAVLFEVLASNLDGTPAYSIVSGADVIDLDTGSCNWQENGAVGTATFKIRTEWDHAQKDDCEIQVYVENVYEHSAGWTEKQTNYFDIINRLVTESFAAPDGRINKGASTTLSGTVYYATDTGGNTASSSYPPDAQFTSVDIHDSGHVERGMDDVIINGAFSDSFNIPDAVQSNTYHGYLDMDPDYSDADAPDGDTAAVIGDQIKILTLAANNTEPAKNEAVLLYATAELEYDHHVLGSGDSLSLEALAFTWNGTSSQWEKVVVSGDAETRTYNEFTLGNEATYTITVGDINGQTVSVTWGAAPSILSASITDMDDTDNIYAMRKYYTWQTVVRDTDGATDIDMVYLQIKNGGEAVGEFRVTDLTGTPAWAIQTGATEFDLDVGSCTWAENGVEGTATFKIRAEWDITQYEDMDIEIYVEDSTGGYANFTEMQTDYVDLISRLVTDGFASNATSARIESPIQIFGSVRYATTIDGNLASDIYPPSGQFTSVTIKNDQEEIEAIDTTISNGNFNVTFNSHTLMRATYYYAWLDLLDDYVDGLAPDGDYVIVSTSSGFYLSWLIDQAFNFFGISNYLSQIYVYGSALALYFVDSITNLLTLITQQFRVALGIFGFFVDWYTRMVSLVIQIGEIITGLIDGTGDITSGLGNLWSYFDVYTWIDVIPVFLFIWWVESIARRGRVQGEISVFLGDIQTVMNITSWFMSMFSLVVNTMTDLAFRLMEAIT